MLTDTDKKIIDLAREHPVWSGTLEGRIRDELDMSPVAFLQRLNYLADLPDANEYAPAVLRRVREWRP